jgi:hypothetical protein
MVQTIPSPKGRSMPCLHFDAEDYLDEISDRDLEMEMERRKLPLDQPALEDIRLRLEHAWRRQDRALFYAALAMMEEPDRAEARRVEIARKYAMAMGRLVEVQ